MPPTSSSTPSGLPFELPTAAPRPGNATAHAGLLSGRWSVRVLGTLEANNGDVRLSHFVSQPIAALLARLLLLPQRAHPREALIELLWPEGDLEVGRNRLRNAISSLRRLLEPPGVTAGSVLVADRQGVQFAPSRCDAIDFEAALRVGDVSRARKRCTGGAAAGPLRRMGVGASPAPRGVVRAGGGRGRADGFDGCGGLANRVLFTAANCHAKLHRYEPALALLTECERRFVASGHVATLPELANVQGYVYANMVRWPQAEQAFARCATGAARLQNMAFGLWNLARPLAHRRQCEAAALLMAFSQRYWTAHFGARPAAHAGGSTRSGSAFARAGGRGVTLTRQREAACPASDPCDAATVRRRRASMPEESIHAPMACSLVELRVKAGDAVRAGQVLLIVEAMKMEHEICAPAAATVLFVAAQAGDAVSAGELLLRLGAMPEVEAVAVTAAVVTPSAPPAPASLPATGASSVPLRADLQEVITRHAFTLDAARPEAVAKRHALGLRTARENVADLCDAGSFTEYGALAIAAQRSRRSLDDLVRNTPADGMVTGIGSINGAVFGAEKSRCVVLAYDATVLAGTQGMRNHAKTDRMLAIALQQKLPVVLFAEGGGGRPGDVDMPIVAGLHVASFASYARLSGQVPVVGIAAGRCFAGNAALLGCSDVIIATRRSNIGLGGPAMVEGGGLGLFTPEQIGPSDVQSANGVIDLRVEDEAAAVAAARQYLAFFQGTTAPWAEADPALLRSALPENRQRAYDMREVMKLVADTASLLELRAGFGAGIFTALARIEGRPVGLIASNPAHLGGAIDADAADKAARFMQLCNAHGLPLVSLVDTPGFMVGPDAEATAQVRHVSRMFVAAAHLRVPFFAVVLRKGYGLGAMAMTGGSFHAPVFTVAWPSGEFGAMGLEGAVRLGYRKELEAAAEGRERDAVFRQHVDEQYAKGKAINMAATLEIDAVIDPADTRRWLARGLAAARVNERVSGGIDPW